MRGTSNPAFRHLPVGQPGSQATFDRQAGAGGAAAGYADMAATGVDYGPATKAERPLTIDDVVIKSAVTFGVALIAGVGTALLPAAYGLALPALIVGLVLSLIIIFKGSTNPALILSYALVEGMFLGAITGALETYVPQYAGIGIQALIGTAGVFVGMLIVYKTGAVRVTPRFTKWMIGALVGVLVLVLVRFVLSIFDPGGFGDRRARVPRVRDQPGDHRRGRVQPAARLRPGRPDGASPALRPDTAGTSRSGCW